ncbi:hypothetical protein IKE84_00620 [Candidatus Saccharibacteria bacterium]|nr:hypothetical protein [Candidatus Saccharibacteria bacterium]
MKDFGQNFRKIISEHRMLFALMILLALASLALLITSLVTLSPSSAVVKVGYGDIGSFAGEDLAEMRTAGGYRDGSWVDMVAFPILAVIIGVIHNLIAVRLFVRRGDNTAKAFIAISFLIVIGAFLVLFRLLGEG